MSDNMPTTEEVRERWMEFDGGPDPDDAAGFDRWLATVRREAKAAAWDEGYEAAETDLTFMDEPQPNPYREDA